VDISGKNEIVHKEMNIGPQITDDWEYN